MQKIGFRECHFIKVNNIDAFIEEFKKSVENFGLPEGYDVRIYKSVYGCCGVSDSNVAVEIVGPDEEEIRNIDLKVTSKLIEICQKKGLEYHFCEPIEVA
ncbi:MAG: hypothetical protein ACUVT5_05545 [Candidatus Bathyarchaeales archaeon]